MQALAEANRAYEEKFGHIYIVCATAKSAGAFFLAWTLLVLGVTSLVSAILSVRGLWSLRRGRPG